jgi:hypothetical protein
MQFHWLALGILALCLTATAAGAAGLELYRPEHRLPAELQELAAGFMGDEGSATADPGTGTLVLRGPRALIEQTLVVLRRIDVPLRSYQIEYELASTEQLARFGLGAEGWVELGDLRVGRATAAEAGLRLQADRSQGQARRRVYSMVRVRDGGWADLWTGAVRPLRSGFRVQPRGLADGSVELAIEAIVSQDSLDAPVARTGARTRIRLEPGEWVALGAIAAQDQVEGRGLVSADGTRRSLDQTLLVRISAGAASAGQ